MTNPLERDALLSLLAGGRMEQSRGPMMRNPTPDWLKRENDSVFDSMPEKAAKALLRLLGADDPSGQVIGIAAPVEVPIMGGMKGMKAAKKVASVAPKSITPPPALRRLYHGSSDPGDLVIQEDKGLFGGVFASGNEDAARSHIWTDTGKVHAFDIPEDAILTQHHLSYEADPATIQSVIRREFPGLTKTEADHFWDLVVENGNVFETPLSPQRLTKHFGAGEASGDMSWRLQQVRGKIAKALGFKAVEMPDEHGLSYLVLPGVSPLRRP